MKQATPKATPFLDSVRWLETRCEWVPVGWQLAYNEALCKLLAIDCAARAHITVSGPYMEDLNLRVGQNGTDSVVAGILGRLERKTAQTCERCGRPGTLRLLDRPVIKVLCGFCAGPRLASAALSRLLRDMNQSVSSSLSKEIWWEAAPVELRPLIPAAAWHVFPGNGTSASIWYTSHAQLTSHRPWLEAVQRALDEAPEADDGH